MTKNHSDLSRTSSFFRSALCMFIASIALPAQTAFSASTSFAEDKPVHVFIFSGQSNMAGMDPETGFAPEARKLFGNEEVVYIKVAKGGQPICRWVKEWADIAKEKGMDARHRERILKSEGVLFYQLILDQYKALLEKHPKPT